MLSIAFLKGVTESTPVKKRRRQSMQSFLRSETSPGTNSAVSPKRESDSIPGVDRSN